jgi:hypothetical protein
MLEPAQASSMLAVERQFCRTPSCEVVYYGEDGRTVAKRDVPVRVGLKERDDPVALCYCFGFARGRARRDRVGRPEYDPGADRRRNPGRTLRLRDQESFGRLLPGRSEPRRRGGVEMADRYDLAVIGGGMGGVKAANEAAHLGARVVLIERGKLGGT